MVLAKNDGSEEKLIIGNSLKLTEVQSDKSLVVCMGDYINQITVEKAGNTGTFTAITYEPWRKKRVLDINLKLFKVGDNMEIEDPDNLGKWIASKLTFKFF